MSGGTNGMTEECLIKIRPKLPSARSTRSSKSTRTKGRDPDCQSGNADNYDYWSMRRYLGEFLSDKRVIDYPAYLWQPLLQLIILTSRPFRSGAAYKSIWNEEEGESPQ